MVHFELLLLALATLTAARNCRCGFSVNSTSDPQHQIFMDYLESDFTKGNWDGWTPQEWYIEQTKARGPYGKIASLNNVVLTEEGMQLWVRKAVDNVISTSEIGSKRTDMVYGTFRMRAKMGTTNGTCGAMFWYHNNTQEIDMEFLSKECNEDDRSNINLVIQSPESQANGFNAKFTPGFAHPELSFRPDEEFHEYRFDWTPSEVAFYADGKLLHVMTESIPDSGGHMVFNHWSNGDPGWSAGPPLQDTYMVVSHAHFYFNTSNEARRDFFKNECPTFDASQVCRVDNKHITQALMPPIGAEEKQRMTTIYIAVGVVVGLVLVGFIGCMVTIRHWVALKNRIGRKLSRRQKGDASDAQEMTDGLRSSTKTPDTELESQVSPMKSEHTRG